jgi:hypothetical protein
VELDRLRRGELVAAAGGLLLVVCLFLPWYSPAADNPNANVEGSRDAVSGWTTHDVLRWLLLLAAIAPFILIWIIIRDHELSWARGELTAVAAIAAFGLVVYNGVIDRPGEPSSEISLALGWFGAVVGIVLMATGAAIRAGAGERRRRPPGVF